MLRLTPPVECAQEQLRFLSAQFIEHASNHIFYNEFDKRQMGLKWLVFSIGSQNVTGMCLERIKEQTLQRHMLENDWTASLSIVNYSTLNNEDNWEDLCIQLRNQQIYPSITINKSREVQMVFLQMFHCRFAIATRLLLCESNRQQLENMRNESNKTHVPYTSREGHSKCVGVRQEYQNFAFTPWVLCWHCVSIKARQPQQSWDLGLLNRAIHVIFTSARMQFPHRTEASLSQCEYDMWQYYMKNHSFLSKQRALYNSRKLAKAGDDNRVEFLAIGIQQHPFQTSIDLPRHHLLQEKHRLTAHGVGAQGKWAQNEHFNLCTHNS